MLLVSTLIAVKIKFSPTSLTVYPILCGRATCFPSYWPVNIFIGAIAALRLFAVPTSILASGFSKYIQDENAPAEEVLHLSA
jgi:hypothetical protein